MVAEEDAIRKLIEEMTDAFNAHDATRCSQIFMADGDLATVRGEWFHGASEIKRGLDEIFTTRAGAARLTPVDIRIRFIRPDVALAHVQNELSGLNGSDGKLLAPHIEFSLRVFSKEDGGWRLAAMHNRRLDHGP